MRLLVAPFNGPSKEPDIYAESALLQPVLCVPSQFARPRFCVACTPSAG